MQRTETNDGNIVNHNKHIPEETKKDSRRNVAIIGSAIVVVAVVVYIIVVYPSQLFSKVQDSDPVGQMPMLQSSHPVVAPSALKTSSEELFASTDAVWAKLFKQEGKTYTKPALQFFEDTIIAQRCGYGKPATGCFYCPADKEIYLDLTFFANLKKRFTSSANLTQAYIIAHQAGHHIQDLLGITAKAEAKRSQMSDTAYQTLANKLELQADYFAGVWAHYAYKETIDFTDMEIAVNNARQLSYDMLQNYDRTMPDPYNNSTISERTKWFGTGYYSGDMNKANVFTPGDLK